MSFNGSANSRILDQYTILEQIGEGGFSKVYQAQCRKTFEDVAIKVINRQDLDKEEEKYIENEIGVLKILDHPNIVRLIDAEYTKDNILVVMELMTGGQLFDRIVQKELFTEEEAIKIMKVLIDTIRYCHEFSVSHRDIKVL